MTKNYQYIEIEKKDNAAWIWISRPPSNDLNIGLMEELIRAHRELEKEKAIWAVFIASRNDTYFCNGLDPAYMLSLSVNERVKVFSVLIKMVKAIYSFSKPEMSIVNGYAMAGGAVLGMLTDFRFMSAEKCRYCFSEVHVGLTIPAPLMDVVESIVGPENLVKAVMLGKAFKSDEALRIGLADAVFPKAELNTEAEKFMRKLLQSPLQSLVSIKRNIRSRKMAKLKDIEKKIMKEIRPFLSGNFEEGLLAVKEKRKPNYKNI